MITWGVKVNDYGNAILDERGEFVKMPEKGVTEELWNEMVAHASSNGLKGGNYKKLNLSFENKLQGLSRDIRERMVQGVEDFVYQLLRNVFNAEDTAPLAIETIIEAGSYDLGPKSTRMEDPAKWTEEKIGERASMLSSKKGPEGDFDD
jgi:hypothetical protein